SARDTRSQRSGTDRHAHGIRFELSGNRPGTGGHAGCCSDAGRTCIKDGCGPHRRATGVTVSNARDQTAAASEAYQAIADGTPPAWHGLDTALTDPDEVEALHLLDDIAAAYRANANATAQRRDVVLRW